MCGLADKQSRFEAYLQIEDHIADRDAPAQRLADRAEDPKWQILDRKLGMAARRGHPRFAPRIMGLVDHAHRSSPLFGEPEMPIILDSRPAVRIVTISSTRGALSALIRTSNDAIYDAAVGSETCGRPLCSTTICQKRLSSTPGYMRNRLLSARLSRHWS